MTKLRYAGGRETRLWLRQCLLLSVLLFPSLCSDVNADMQSVLPDFYSEPGLHPFRNQVSGTTVEHVDPFSGSLALTHVDLRVPGANGLDIEIRRVYSSNVHLARKAPNSVAPFPDQLLPRTPTGIGWTIHFGRVILSASADPTASICDTHAADPEDDTNNNPVLELPDGSIKVLHVSAITNDQGLEEDDWITRDGWFANC